MSGKLISRRTLLVLVATTLLLVATSAVVLALAAALLEMGDSTPGHVLCWIALGLGVLLVVDVFFLILALAINSLAESEEQRPAASEAKPSTGE